jgi:hypothetical protein
MWLWRQANHDHTFDVDVDINIDDYKHDHHDDNHDNNHDNDDDDATATATATATLPHCSVGKSVPRRRVLSQSPIRTDLRGKRSASHLYEQQRSEVGTSVTATVGRMVRV